VDDEDVVVCLLLARRFTYQESGSMQPICFLLHT